EKHMDIINRNVDTCNKVIRDLFSYAHATNYQFEEVNTAKFIKSINDFIEEKLNEYPYIKISVNYDRDLPPIYIDEFRLTQAFQNIINNAFEAMTKKGRFTLNVKALKTEKQVQFLFTDTGSGIPDEDLPQIFQSFYSSKSKGFGLGLALTKEIIEFHHGKISVNSILHHGTTFKVTIPAFQ
ncbi:MAG TPA: ATP-binding protein, partial [Candidatus Marinimicrobia bacterium]|nr:ATP-binding protein [Candidatus Neomarinimicrobiota bacterium]